LFTRLDLLTNFVSQKLSLELSLNEKFYQQAFSVYAASFSPDFNFRSFCTRVLVKRFLVEVLDTVRNSADSIGRMRSENVKAHLNLHLLVKRFLADNHLDRYTLDEFLLFGSQPVARLPEFSSLNELFQPFLIEFIRDQEDQFIKYIHKIYDTDKISLLAEEIVDKLNQQTDVHHSLASSSALFDATAIQAATAMHGFELKNYSSPSVTDLFTILHELLQTIVLFDSKNSDTNLAHQLCFVNLIKSKLLAYSAHVKCEYHKIAAVASDHLAAIEPTINRLTALDITSCILMNNFKKTIQLLDDIESRLTSRSQLKRVVLDQLESIKVILKDDLANMIVEYAKEFERPLIEACKSFQYKMHNSDAYEYLNTMKNFIDERLYYIFNDRFTVCKIILFDSLFRRLLGEIFKLAVRCVESSVILSRDENGVCQLGGGGGETDESPGGKGLLLKLGEYFTKTKKTLTKENKLVTDVQYKVK
jgi:HPt (histidine-containing phosphotransfer) domain-containing protein